MTKKQKKLTYCDSNNLFSRDHEVEVRENQYEKEQIEIEDSTKLGGIQ